MFIAFVMVLGLFVPFASATTVQQKPLGQSESTLALKAAIAEQERLRQNGPVLDDRLKNLKDDELVDVIVHLSQAPVSLQQGKSELRGQKFSNARANEVRANVKAQQTKVKKAFAAKNVAFDTIYEFDTVLNGFAATVKAGDLPKLLTIEGVTLVEPDATVYASEASETVVSEEQSYDALMNTSNSFLGIERLWNEGLEGQGIKVAVLDTGIDADHPEFAGIYKGGKNFILHSSTYATPRADDDASETLPSERPANVPEFNANGSSFYTSHGTHVAGTIAAIGANDFGIKGIAPKVDLYAYRVLGAYGSGATSGIVKAIETSVVEDMDVINLSLGGGANSETDAGSFAINNAMMAGVISVIATGNSGPNRGTMGTPATARLGIAVGNTTNPETMHAGTVSVTVGDYNYSKKLNLMSTTFGQNLAQQLDGEFEIIAVPGVGSPKDFEGLNVEGKVALIARGELPFVDKIANAKANGAVATIIHNFAGGTGAPGPSNVFLGDSFGFLPTFDMSLTDATEIRSALTAGEGKVTFNNFTTTKTAGDDVNSSSSRGPSTPNFDIKPDVTAPGTNIMSTIPMYKADFPEVSYAEAYDRKTGTSMATPHIAGIAALVKQANPEWNAFDVKVALSNTAKILDTTKYDVFSQGAGRVDAYAAAHPEILAYAQDTAVVDATGAIVENLKGTITFGPRSLDQNLSVTKQVQVKDFTGNGGTYSVEVKTTKTFGDAKVTVDQPTLTVDGEATLNVTLTASAATTKAGDEILGYVVLKNDTTEISLPFAADFAKAAGTEIRNYRLSEKDVSFNGDGIKDSSSLAFTLTGPVTTNFIEIWDIENPTGGEYGDGYIGYLHSGASLAAGSYTLQIGGQYKPWGAAPATTIPDGLYTIDFTGLTPGEVVQAYDGPFIVKTTKPEISAELNGEEVIGQVMDKYIDYNEVLALYGLDYKLNDKLKASYTLSENGEQQAPEAFLLNEDGTFTLPVTETTTALSVTVTDAAGNSQTSLVFERELEEPEPVVTLVAEDEVIKLAPGKSTTFKIFEKTTVGETVTEKDVTNLATYSFTKKNAVAIKNGVLSARGPGETTVTAAYGGQTVTFKVIVTPPGKK